MGDYSSWLNGCGCRSSAGNGPGKLERDVRSGSIETGLDEGSKLDGGRMCCETRAGEVNESWSIVGRFE